MAKILSKMDIVQCNDRVLELVEVPEWGGSVYVRSMTAAERSRIEGDAAKFKETKGKDSSFAQTFTVRMAGLCVCDEQGNRLFSDSEFDLLRQKNALAVSRVAEVAQRLNGFSKADVEALEKNSETAQPDASVSA
jgi:hypothetical protein